MSTAEMTKEAVFKNSGPIKGFFRATLDGPGLYELRGSKGTGKSTVLQALSSVVSGHNVSITVHDGELDGSVEAFGRIVPLGSNKKPRGTSEVHAIDTEKFDLVDLIDPQGKTEKTRDANRIKALASLCGLKLKPDDFYELVGGQQDFEEMGIEETDDPVLFASRVKAAIDRVAKAREEYSNTVKGRVKTLEDQAKAVDLTAESDSEVLANLVEQATTHAAELRQKCDHAAEVNQKSQEAREQLEEAQESYTGPNVEQAGQDVEDKRQTLHEKLERKQELERLLAEAKEELATAQGEYNESLAVETAAAQHAEDIRRWNESISPVVEPPSMEEIDNAKQAVQDARLAQEQGVRIRDAKKALQEAELHKANAVDAFEQAESLRAAASEVFSVLRAKLKTTHIRIESVAGVPRLVVDHATRGKTFFDKVDGLSDGERVCTVMDELLPHIKSPGIFPIPQRTYQDIPPADRLALAQEAAKRGLFAWGAQVTDGELTVVKVQ